MTELPPVPERMAHLPRDERGYPVPFVVYRDKAGTPHFTINDANRTDAVIRADRCPICNQTLFRGRWFVGGPASAFHPDGAYLDPPMHYECAEYALRVCPYLAAPRYAKRIDSRTVPQGLGEPVYLDPTVDPTRPGVFVAVMSIGQSFGGYNGPFRYIQPVRPYRRVEFWRHGCRISEAEAKQFFTMEDACAAR